MKHRAIAILVLASCMITLGTSGGVYAIAQPNSPSVDDMVRALKPPKVISRSLGRNLQAERAQIDLTVEFDFDSARLRSESLPLLERLSTAMRSEALNGLRFRIEGHTDAVGTADYNMKLSNRRALTIEEFLGSQGVDRKRLESVGKGASELLVPADPLSATNRRVRVVTNE
jgi:outer membrane protein OmpA-like peptidoglycan-associated protein